MFLLPGTYSLPFRLMEDRVYKLLSGMSTLKIPCYHSRNDAPCIDPSGLIKSRLKLLDALGFLIAIVWTQYAL